MDRKTKINIAILESLDKAPEGYPMPDASIRADVYADVEPNPTLQELEESLKHLEGLSFIGGRRNEFTGIRKWIITDAGRLALGQM